MDAKFGNFPKEGVVGIFGVPGVNKKGERFVQLRLERESRVRNAYFKKRNLRQEVFN